MFRTITNTCLKHQNVLLKYLPSPQRSILPFTTTSSLQRFEFNQPHNNINQRLFTQQEPELTIQRGYKKRSDQYNRYNNERHNNNHHQQQQQQSEDEILKCSAYCIGKSINQKNLLTGLPESFSLDKVFPDSNVMWLRYGKNQHVVNDISSNSSNNTNNSNNSNSISKTITKPSIQQLEEGDVFIFPSFGGVVVWGVPEQAQANLFKWLNESCIEPIQPQIDTYSYTEGNSTNAFEIDSRYREIITLSSSTADQFKEMFATSYALAQSVRLFLIEDDVNRLSRRVENIPNDLAKNGHVNISKVEIVKQLGEQMKIKNYINLHSDIIDTPEHFWEHTEGEGIYKIVRSHCEIDKRVRIMNERLNLISGIYDVINDEMKHSHSIRLERIIIALIAIEGTSGILHWFY